MSKAEETQIPLKVLVDKGSNRADHSFVDILFSFLTLPMGTIVQLIGENSDLKIGSLNILYEGLENLSSECFWTEDCKPMLLNPRSSSDSYCSQLQLNVQETIPTKYLMCRNWTYCCAKKEDIAVFSTCNSANCSSGVKLNLEVRFPKKLEVNMNAGIFVNETASFIITEDLLVKPNSLDLSIQLLNGLGITGVTNIEERIIYIGLQQVSNLLTLALFSSTPLTNLLLREGKTIQELVRCEPSNLTQPQVNKVLEEPTNARGSLKFKAKAFVRNSNGKLLFVQAKGDFIDFLFSFLAVPLGAVEWFLNGTNYVSPSIDNLYTSLSNMSVGQYMKSREVKDMLLDPPLPQQYMCKNQLLTLNDPIPLKYYYYHYDWEMRFITPSVQQQLGNYKCLALKDPMLDGEFVRGTATFMVTDDLTVTPFLQFPLFPTSASRKINLLIFRNTK